VAADDGKAIKVDVSSRHFQYHSGMYANESTHVWHKGWLQHASLQATPIELGGVEERVGHHILPAHASVAAAQALLYRFS